MPYLARQRVEDDDLRNLHLVPLHGSLLPLPSGRHADKLLAVVRHGAPARRRRCQQRRRRGRLAIVINGCGGASRGRREEVAGLAPAPAAPAPAARGRGQRALLLEQKGRGRGRGHGRRLRLFPITLLARARAGHHRRVPLVLFVGGGDVAQAEGEVAQRERDEDRGGAQCRKGRGGHRLQ